jgi:hypothetical protein
MPAIRHQLVVLVGLALLSLAIGLTSTLWVALTLAVVIGVNRSTRLVTGYALVMTLTWLSLVLAVVGVVVLSLAVGWMATLGYIVVFLLYFVAFTVLENDYVRSLRRVEALRRALCDLIRARTSSSISDEQLAARVAALLASDLHERDFLDDGSCNLLASSDGLSAVEHRRLLELLQRHLAEVERYNYWGQSNLNRTIHSQLGHA